MDILDLSHFAEGLKAKFSLPGSAAPEDQLKPSVAVLFKDAGTRYGLTVANANRSVPPLSKKCAPTLQSMLAA